MTALRLQFSCEGGAFSTLIGWFSHSQFAHVDLALDDGSLIGARLKGGVQRRPAGYANFARTKAIEIAVENDAAAAAFEFLNGQIGKPYDWTAIAGFAAGRDWRDADSWFCSELAGRVCEIANVFRTPLCVPTNKLTPGDLLLALSAIGAV